MVKTKTNRPQGKDTDKDKTGAGYRKGKDAEYKL